MTDLAKKIILEANEHIKSAHKCFEMIYTQMEITEDLKKNAFIACAELIKCIKHIALMQGDITGKELMPEAMLEKQALVPKPEDEQAH